MTAAIPVVPMTAARVTRTTLTATPILHEAALAVPASQAVTDPAAATGRRVSETSVHVVTKDSVDAAMRSEMVVEIDVSEALHETKGNSEETP